MPSLWLSRMTDNFEFWTVDKRFGLSISQSLLSEIAETCVRSIPNETGGVLIGYYNRLHDCAIVTAISAEPADSDSGPNCFYRGIHGLQTWIDRLWKSKRDFYLGEWHSHPFASSIPSVIDIRQMGRIATSQSYNCPEPILLIVGGYLATDPNAKAYVFPRNEPLMEMFAPPYD